MILFIIEIIDNKKLVPISFSIYDRLEKEIQILTTELIKSSISIEKKKLLSKIY